MDAPDFNDVEGYESFGFSEPTEYAGEMSAGLTTGASQPQEDPLMDLIAQQKSDGSFSWAPSMETVLGMTEEKLRVVKPADNTVTEDVWLTAVVVAHLELKMAEQRDMWVLVADKAYKFVEESCGDKELEKMVKREAVALVEGPK